MSFIKNSFIVIIVGLLSGSCSTSETKNWEKKSADPAYIHRSIKQITDVIVQDIYSPPVASRTYAYISIAGYEAAIHGSTKYLSLAGQLNALSPLPKPDPGKQYSFHLASVHSILAVGKSMVSSEKKIEEFHKKIMEEFKASGMPDEVFQNSISFGDQVAGHILAWAAKDNYKQTRSFSKFSISDDDNSWKPTPPSYMKAVEPHWNKIRTFLIDSAQQFKPFPPTPFSSDKNSQFYKEALDVHKKGLDLSSEQIEIANFWDCNPFKMNINGHVMFATKKISPGGHWINITRLASKKSNADFIQSAEAYASLSITLADSFISCWDEKYRSNVIRPETFINQYIDENWMPLLQTPPFPEYTSGHSVASTASAVMLSKLFGENFSYDDSTEVEFGIPVRKFQSFKQAAKEAAISRFYGGIHFMPSITNGMEEGNKIGEFVSQRLKTKKNDVSQKNSVIGF